MKKNIAWTSILLISCAVWFALTVPLTAAGGDSRVQSAGLYSGKAAAAPAQASDSGSGTAGEQTQSSDSRSKAAVTGPAPASTPKAAPVKEASLEDKVNEWIHALAKEKGFEAWSSAQWDKYPLGPGTHEWLILLHGKNNQQDVGYLVVGATEQGGYQLIEYGTGSNPLFSLNTLYHSMVQLELIPKHLSYAIFIGDQLRSFNPERLYIVPLQAAWRLTKDGKTWYIDAKTGRKLPDLSGVFSAGTTSSKAATGAKPGNQPVPRILQRLEKEPFDPFENTGWVHGKPLPSESFDEIRKLLLLENRRITYSGKWFGGKAVYPLAVTGYHVWDTEGPFVRLDHDGGPRFVRFAEAGLLGHYYPYLYNRETAINLL